MRNLRLNNGKLTTPMGANPEPDGYAETLEQTYTTPSLKELVRVLRKRFWIIALVTIFLVGGAVGFSFMQTPMYQASIKILIGEQSSTRDSMRSDAQGLQHVQGLQQITQTMAEAVNNRSLAEDVVQQLNLSITPGHLQGNLTAKPIRATQFIQVDYFDTDAERAQEVANAVGGKFSEQLSDTSPIPNAVTATVWEPAEASKPVSPKPVRNALLALALGVILGVALAFLLDYLDNSWRSLREIERISGVPVLGAIPKHKVSTHKQERRR